MGKKSRPFTDDEDELIMSRWPDYKGVACLIEDKTDGQVYRRGLRYLGLDAMSDEERYAVHD